MPWNPIRFEVRRGANHDQTHVPGHRHRDHVTLNELSRLNTGVVLSRNKVHRIV